MPRRDYQPGERIPGTVYEVVRLIGAGGMGTVYDVEDTSIGKRYVLKTLHPQLGAREDLARRMQNEARTLARLNHPNIVEVITAGVTSDDLKLPFYVMERLNGQSLRVVLEKKGQLELPHAYHIAIDLLDALDHAHDKGVIHRDVKPDNIFLHRTSAGVTVTKLLDFGIMSLLDGQSRETAGRFLGTLRYAAPEQLGGERPTPRMDIYAAGLVLYEMVTGRGPFDDEGDPQKVAGAHIHKMPPPPSRFANLPRDLDALLMAALSKSPEMRPRDAFSFAASLRNLKRALAGAPAPGAPESTENRATAAAVLGPAGAASAAAPLVNVRQSAPDGPFVISPVPQSPPPSVPGATGQGPRTALPRTTLAGMAPPTVGPPLASMHGAGASATATTPEAVDRMAATHSLVVDTPRMPQQGTDPMGAAMPVAPTLPSDAPGVGGAAGAPGVTGGAGGAGVTGVPATLPAAGVRGAPPFQWPRERSPSLSEEPQVHSLPVDAPAGRRSPGLVAAIVAGVALLGAAAAAVVLVRHPTTLKDGAAGRAQTAFVAPVAPPAVPPSAAVLAMPAPTLAPPALDEPSPPTAAASAAAPATAIASTAAPASKHSHAKPGPSAATPSAPPGAAPRPAPSSTSPAPTHAPAPAPLPDRPGPGF